MAHCSACALHPPARILLAAGIAFFAVFVTSRVLAASIHLRSADFDILDARSQQVVGAAHFEIGPSRNGKQAVVSEARYKSGDYDIEYDDFDTQAAGSIPQMISYLHTFYHPDGTLFLKSNIDFRTGSVACTTYPKGAPSVATQSFKLPPNTYAGAATILPLQDSLRAGDRGPITMDDVVCMPGPKLVKVEARARPPAPWDNYPHAVQADIKPDFGWLDYLIAPFLPEMHAWFSPAHDLELIGAQFARYYKGPEIILRRVNPPSASEPENRMQALRSR
jgi:hypothetical protein